jgi:hypothetical protein
MNGVMYSHDQPTGFYTGSDPIHPTYRNQYPSTFTTNSHLNQSYSHNTNGNNYSQQTFKPAPMQSNSFTQQDIDMQRQLYMTNLQQQPTNPNVYNFENGGLSSTAYYDRIHAQVRSNTPAYQQQNSTSTNTINSSFQHPYTQSLSPDSSRQPTPLMTNNQTEPTFLVVPGAGPVKSTSPPQVI